MYKSQFRFHTYDIIQTPVKEFDYLYDKSMQDWEYEVAKLSDIEVYFTTYDATNDDDVRFSLMEMILETSNEDPEFDWISEFWLRVQQLLRKNFLVHERTVYYWSLWDEKEIEDCFYITASMRMLWNEHRR